MRAIATGDSPDRRPVAGGPFKQAMSLRPGLTLNVGDMLECEDIVGSTVDCNRLRIVLVLEGNLDMTYAGHRLQLHGSRAGARIASRADSAMVSMEGPTEFQRRARRGDYSRRISIGLGREWIEQSLRSDAAVVMPGADRFLEGRPDALCWRASAYARSLAEQILNPPPLPEGISRLYLESRVIGLVVEALAGQASSASPKSSLRPSMHQRMCELRRYLAGQAEQTLDMAEIARQVGTSVATLQRCFRQAHGLTISAFVLQVRLTRARQALEYQGVSVARAALLAGYANPANFATAFRRHYGLSPRQVRSRI